MSIPNNNIDCVEMFKAALQRRINLFTGAGFSALPDPDGKCLPDATQLCEDICDRFQLIQNIKAI